MKRTLLVLLIFCIFLSALCACGEKAEPIPGKVQTTQTSETALVDTQTAATVLTETEKAPTTETETAAQTQTTPTPTPTTPTPTQTTESPTPEQFEPFTLGFTGDVSYAETYYQKAEKSNSSGIVNRARSRGRALSDCISEGMLAEMRRLDLLFVNCESSVSDRGEPLGLKGKEYSFRTSTENAKMFKEIGAGLIGLANNHVYDFGEEAFLDTLDTFKEMGLPTVGAGRNIAQAYEPYYYTKSGMTIAIFATSCAEKNYFTLVAEEDAPGICGCYDETLICEKITEAKEKADFVIVIPHYGMEGTSDIIEDKQRNVSYHFIDAGADLVIGGHAHRIQGIDSYKGKLIFWNLGNFLFNNSTLDTMLLELTFRSKDDYQLRIMPGTQTDGTVIDNFGTEKGEQILQFLRVRSYGIAIDEEGYVYDCKMWEAPENK